MFSAPVTWGPVGQRAGGGEALEPARGGFSRWAATQSEEISFMEIELMQNR